MLIVLTLPESTLPECIRYNAVLNVYSYICADIRVAHIGVLDTYPAGT